MSDCTIVVCDNVAHAHGLCMKHYQRVRKTGTTERVLAGTCSATGCLRPSRTLGMCNMHYQRQRRGMRLDAPTPGDVAARFWDRVNKGGDCWEWTSPRNVRGYGNFGVNGRTVLAHRWSYEQINGPIPDGLCVLHRCDNPPCVNPAHLWLGTRADNTADAIAKGRHLQGDTSPVAKLTAEQVLAIRAEATHGVGQSELAVAYGVARTTVESIVHRRTWKGI